MSAKTALLVEWLSDPMTYQSKRNMIVWYREEMAGKKREELYFIFAVQF